MILYILVIATLVAEALSNEVPACPKGWTLFPTDNSCIKLCILELPYDEARETCLGVGADLVKIDSAAKNNFVRGLVEDDARVWIGVVDKDHSRKWTYIDGSPLTYTSWVPNNPNNLNNNESCGIMWSGTDWNDINCASPNNFVCEKRSGPSCPIEWRMFPGDTSCMKAGQEEIPYYDARVVCEGFGGDLVMIDSAAKNEFVRGLMQPDVKLWIGVADKDETETWTYIDGSPLTYRSWMPGKPNNENNNQFCGSMWQGTKWNDDTCANKHAFVCAIPGPPSPTDVPKVPECPKEWVNFPNDNSCLKFSPLKIPYYDARTSCQDVGGDMVKIDTEGKNSFVRGLVPADDQYWIGVVDKNHDGTWTHTDGSPLTYQSWTKGNPSNWKKEQACGCVWKGTGWKDLSCSKPYAFVCEIPGGKFRGTVPDLEANWVVHTFTSDKRHAGTDDHVWIQFRGSRGASRVLLLNNPGDDHERGRVGTYKVITRNVGTPTYMEVTAGAKGDGWHVDKIVLELEEQVKNASWISHTFGCNCWIDADHSATPRGVKRLTKTDQGWKNRWKVTVYTKNVKYAGTDDEVFIQVHGERHIGDKVELDTKSDDFERGRWDTFTVTTNDLLPVGIRVWGGEDGDGWFLEKVELQLDVGSGDVPTHVFHCDCWFDADKPKTSPTTRYIHGKTIPPEVVVKT